MKPETVFAEENYKNHQKKRRKLKKKRKKLRLSLLKMIEISKRKLKEKSAKNLRLSSLKEKGDISPAEPGTRLISLS